MSTLITTPADFVHFVPYAEPPIGTVAIFSLPGIGGPGHQFPMLVRTSNGWTSHPDSQYGESWENLTHLPSMNKVMMSRYCLTFDAVNVRIVAVPAAVHS